MFKVKKLATLKMNSQIIYQNDYYVGKKSYAKLRQSIIKDFIKDKNIKVSIRTIND